MVPRRRNQQLLIFVEGLCSLDWILASCAQGIGHFGNLGIDPIGEQRTLVVWILEEIGALSFIGNISQGLSNAAQA